MCSFKVVKGCILTRTEQGVRMKLGKQLSRVGLTEFIVKYGKNSVPLPHDTLFGLVAGSIACHKAHLDGMRKNLISVQGACTCILQVLFRLVKCT